MKKNPVSYNMNDALDMLDQNASDLEGFESESSFADYDKFDLGKTFQESALMVTVMAVMTTMRRK